MLMLVLANAIEVDKRLECVFVPITVDVILKFSIKRHDYFRSYLHE